MTEFKLEDPGPILDFPRKLHVHQDVEDFAKAHPNQWFVAQEKDRHSPLGGRFRRLPYEQKQRIKVIDGKKMHVTYLRYVVHE